MTTGDCPAADHLSQVPDAEKTIIDAINALLAARGDDDLEVTTSSGLTLDLELDSLELAELSATLEDSLGRDPFSEGVVPDTVGELVGYYA